MNIFLIKKKDKKYICIFDIIQKTFLTFKYDLNIKISYKINSKYRNFYLKSIEEDLYIIFINLIKNAIKEVKKNNHSEIFFNVNFIIENKKFLISVNNSNSIISDENIKKFLGEKKIDKYKENSKGFIIINEALKRNNGRIIKISNNPNYSVSFILEFNDIEYKFNIKKSLKILIIDNDMYIIERWKNILNKHEISFYLNPEELIMEILYNKINIDDYDIIIIDNIFNSFYDSQIITSDSIRLGYIIKERYKYKGVLFMSSNLSDEEFKIHKDNKYIDKNITNKFLEENEILELYFIHQNKKRLI